MKLQIICCGIKLKTNKLKINVQPNQKINIEFSQLQASASVVNCNIDVESITCASCGGITKVYEGINAICEYCGARLNK